MIIEPTNFKFAIGVPNSWTHVPSSFFDSFIQMYKPNFVYIPKKNGPLDGLRNAIVEDALKQGCTHLLMMDVDQVYPIDTIPKLLKHDLPIVHGQVHRRYPPFDPLMYEGEIGNFKSKVDYEDGELVEVDASGTGCVLYQTKVFQTISPPWFKFVKDPNKNHDVIGEDIWFCKKAKEAGYKIYVDTDVEVVHLTMIGITKEFFRMYQELLKTQRNLETKTIIGGN